MMQGVRRTVPDAVQEIITGNPSLYQCLKMKVLNYNAVAKMIQDEVTAMVGKPVNPNTIVAAIIRFSNSLEKEKPETPFEVLGEAKLDLVTGVSDMTISCPAEEQYELVEKILNIASRGNYSVRINQFPTFIKVTTDSSELEQKIRAMKKEELRTAGGGRHAELHVKLSPETMLAPGIMAFVTDLLFRNGISAVNGFFADEDIILTLDETYASRAFESLRREISRMAQD
jgi:hypothetical protein